MIQLTYTHENNVFVQERELTQQEQESVTSREILPEGIVKYYQGDEPDLSLDHLKAIRIAEVDLKTHTKISEGVVFDGRMFSMSQYAQLKWTGIGSSINFGILVEGDFPLIFSDTSNARYELTWPNRTGFLQAVLDRVRIWTESGNELKQAVLDAQDQEELDAVIDDRE